MISENVGASLEQRALVITPIEASERLAATVRRSQLTQLTLLCGSEIVGTENEGSPSIAP
jgi:hypothetical protein